MLHCKKALKLIQLTKKERNACYKLTGNWNHAVMTTDTQHNSGLILVYDGECPICRTAVRVYRVKQTVGNIELINAREHHSHPVMHTIKERQLNLDEGMVALYEEQLYHGADAVHLMALLGSHSTWLNRLNAWLFRSRTRARICYPVLRFIRRLLLIMLGVGRIHSPDDSKSQ